MKGYFLTKYSDLIPVQLAVVTCCITTIIFIDALHEVHVFKFYLSLLSPLPTTWFISYVEEKSTQKVSLP